MNINYYEIIVYLYMFQKTMYLTKTAEYKEAVKRFEHGSIIGHVLAVFMLMLYTFILYKAIHFKG